MTLKNDDLIYLIVPEEDYEINFLLVFVFGLLTFEYIKHTNRNIEYNELFLVLEVFHLK